MILYPLPPEELFADATRRRVNRVIQRMVCTYIHGIIRVCRYVHVTLIQSQTSRLYPCVAGKR